MNPKSGLPRVIRGIGLVIGLFCSSPFAHAVTNIWTGLGGDNFWTTAANWSNNLAPVPGNDLLFPTGAMRLVNSNNFAAGTIFNALAFSGGNYTLRGARIALNAGIDGSLATGPNTVQIPLTLNSNETVTTATALLTLSGAIDTNGKNLIFAGLGTTISGSIGGSGGLVNTGPGFVSLLVSNSFSGPVQILQGSLSISHSNALGTTGGNTTISNGATLSLALPITVAETLVLSGTLVSAGTAGTRIWSGPVSLGSTNATIQANAGAPLTINGILSGGGFSKTGPDLLTLTAANTYTGLTTVAAGTLRVNGSQASHAILLTGGALEGLGTVGNVTSIAGTPTALAPGVGGPGSFTCSNLTLSASTTFAVELNGTTAGSSYDQLHVRGTTALSNALLSVSLGFVSGVGQTFMILENDGIDPIIGTFAGLPEGKTLAVGSNQFRLSYAGGTGNDVVLVRTNVSVTGVSRVWTGAGTNNFWTTPDNWTNRQPAGPGDDILFPAGAARLINSNDLPTGITINSITFSGFNYSLSGSNLLLNAGVTATNSSGGNSVLFPITLNSNQTFSCVNAAGAVNFFQTINLNGKDLTFGGGGFVAFAGPIQGAGALFKIGNGSGALSVSNNISGPVQVLQGSLSVSHANALGSTNSSTSIAEGATLFVINQIILSEPLLLAGTIGGGSGFSTLKGPIVLTGTNVNFGIPLIVDGIISGTNGFTKIASDLLILNANNTYTGLTRLSEGMLQVNGSQPGSAILLEGSALNRNLSGTGRVGIVTCTSPLLNIIQPGNFGPGILNCSNVTLNSSSFLGAELNGSTPGSGYDQLNVSGSVNLANANLAVSLGFAVSAGTTFVIINNDAAEPISGFFQNLPEGAIFTNSGAFLSISYIGGDGNDVVLRTLNPPPQLTIAPSTNGAAQVMGVGVSNTLYTIEATTNLGGMIVWSNLGTALASNGGVFIFTDPNAPLFPMRFYRAVSP